VGVHVDEGAGAEQLTTLNELAAEGARRMLAAALEAEVDAYVTALSDERGCCLVVRNGHAVGRSLLTGAEPIEVSAPPVDDRRVDEATGHKMRFRSSILPPWARKSPKVAEVLPLMYLHGMSSGDFVPPLEEFFGSAVGLGGEPADHRVAKECDQFANGSLKTSTTSTCRPTGSTSTSAWRRAACAPWSSWVCAQTGERSWSRLTMATGTRPSPGPTCCEG
jgi:hypothetical protein